MFFVDEIKAMLNVRFSEKGSNDFRKEQAAYSFFLEYMDNCESATVSINESEADGKAIKISQLLLLSTAVDY